MKKVSIAVIAGSLLLTILGSCNQNANNKNSPGPGIMASQQTDGSIHLKLEEATCYSDKVNPSSNTAEWTFAVPKPGRFKVWLCSATRDTTNLNYTAPVKISLLDNQLERNPECDKIVKNSAGVDFPYFRTESYMGTFYIPEPGEYNIQVISEKVTEKANQDHLIADNTKLMSLILEPMTR